jgi:DNA-binding NarL/FixJ family response regulator
MARVYLYGKDVVLLAGVASQLRRCGRVQLAEGHHYDADGVAVVATDEVGDDVVGAITAVRRACTSRVIVIANRVTRRDVTAALDAGAWAYVRRGDARPDRLAEEVSAVLARNEPPRTVAEALGGYADQLEPEPAEPDRPVGLSDRDLEVLRLMADGLSTAAIAEQLAYSESTIKNIIHAIVGRLGARNRAHAVAIAVRSGLI